MKKKYKIQVQVYHKSPFNAYKHEICIPNDMWCQTAEKRKNKSYGLISILWSSIYIDDHKAENNRNKGKLMNESTRVLKKKNGRWIKTIQLCVCVNDDDDDDDVPPSAYQRDQSNSVWQTVKVCGVCVCAFGKHQNVSISWICIKDQLCYYSKIKQQLNQSMINKEKSHWSIIQLAIGIFFSIHIFNGNNIVI